MNANLVLIKKCHHCGFLMELGHEVEKCKKCKKTFLPSNYFLKIHDKESKYSSFFSKTSELHESELVKGLHVLW